MSRTRRGPALVAARTLLAVLCLWPTLPASARVPGPPPAPDGVAQGVGGFAPSSARPGPYLVPAVVYATADGHIHELALKGAWQHRDLTAAAMAPAAIGELMALRRGDGVSMVVYLGADYHIHSIYLELTLRDSRWEEQWKWADLTVITQAALAGSEPYGYVRSDGISAVVYAGGDNHIHELRLENGWRWADLTSQHGAPDWAGFNLAAYARSDGINTIVYACSGGHVCELRLDGGWKWARLTEITGAPAPMSAPQAYVRSEGISTINYIAGDGHIHELRLEGGWLWADLTAIASAPPASSVWSDTARGYVRSDGVNAIVFGTGPAQGRGVYELWLENGWQWYEMTSVANAVPGQCPFGYVRDDGISTVVYLDTNGHIDEIRLESAWIWADLTQLAGAPDATGCPWAYNRSTVSSVYLPMTRRNAR